MSPAVLEAPAVSSLKATVPDVAQETLQRVANPSLVSESILLPKRIFCGTIAFKKLQNALDSSTLTSWSCSNYEKNGATVWKGYSAEGTFHYVTGSGLCNQFSFSSFDGADHIVAYGRSGMHLYNRLLTKLLDAKVEPTFTGLPYPPATKTPE